MVWWLYVWSVQADVPKKLPPSKERGEILYKQLCWQCHGEQGRADGPLATSLKSSIPVISGTSTTTEKERIDIIQYGKGVMPAYEQLIDRHDSRRILLWLKDPVPQKKEEKPEEKPKKKKDVQ